MSKWPMQGHFRYLRFKTFPMTLRTVNARCFGPWCQALNIRESRRTRSPQLWECWASLPHFAKVGLWHFWCLLYHCIDWIDVLKLFCNFYVLWFNKNMILLTFIHVLQSWRVIINNLFCSTWFLIYGGHQALTFLHGM